MNTKFLFAMSLLICFVKLASAGETAENIFNNHQFLKKYLRTGETPDSVEILQVKYGNDEVTPDATLNPVDIKNKPTQMHWTTEPDQLYTIMMLDNDTDYHVHWFHNNVKGNDIGSGSSMQPYISPKANQTPHTYIFLVYKQTQKIPGALCVRTSRSFPLQFAWAQNLTPLVAINIFKA
ncbi:phosphatidylethanolamine-binding protein domain-containing protein [Ditylenchus destructor]|uniref:Phosphatidylethanolamine-binding protein domain-containing protein n=1 Tax=Ditylenchus destructor TaxID=166010 RepID=A0AAD4MFI4_9BILA|nr:phosphatidylethanolamine-binding protein domain-containing protein [Ditylenchus destructor]